MRLSSLNPLFVRASVRTEQLRKRRRSRTVSIPYSSGQAFGPNNFANADVRALSQSLIRQGKRSDRRATLKCSTVRRVSIPYSSGQAFGRVKGLPEREALESQSLIRQGKRSDLYKVGNGRLVVVSIPYSSGQVFGQTGVDNERNINALRKAVCGHAVFHWPASVRRSRDVDCQRAPVTTRTGCRWRAGSYHRRRALRRSTPGTPARRRSGGR